MERDARKQQEAQAFRNKLQARQANVSRAEGFIHVSRGKRYYKNGVGQPTRRENGKR